MPSPRVKSALRGPRKGKDTQKALSAGIGMKFSFLSFQLLDGEM